MLLSTRAVLSPQKVSFPMAFSCLLSQTTSFNFDISVNYRWADTRWQQYGTHLHTNNTRKTPINLGKVRAVLRLGTYTLAFSLDKGTGKR